MTDPTRRSGPLEGCLRGSPRLRRALDAIRHPALPRFSSVAITDLITCSGLFILKSKESTSAEKVAMLRSRAGK
jgi:hypothetical protein